MTGLTLAPRQDVKREALPKGVRLPDAELRLMGASNAWRACHTTSEYWKIANDKYQRLEGLLNDPDLKAEHPDGSEERIKAEFRLSELWTERDTLAKQFRLEAAAFDKAFKYVNPNDQAELIENYPRGWCDSPLFELALIVPVIPSLPAWIALFAQFRSLKEDECDPPPY
jgi:hypothetical protein